MTPYVSRMMWLVLICTLTANNAGFGQEPTIPDAAQGSGAARITAAQMAVQVAAQGAAPKKPPLAFPIIEKYGGVLPRPGAAEQPSAGAKVLLDVTADSKPGEVNKGLDRVARLLNLYGVAGLKSTDVKVAVVLHGEATKAALNDAAYQQRFDHPANPNLPLIQALKAAGVEVLVCGQALNYKGFADQEVADRVTIAASALTAVINRQTDGFAYVPVP